MSKLFGMASGGGASSALDGGRDPAKASDKTIVRNLLVNITGNRMHWQQMGALGAMWRINDEQAKAIFAPDDTILSNPLLQDRISRALIRRVTVLESNSNIDDTVGVVIDNLPPHEFTANGDGASLYLTGKGRVTAPQEVFKLSANSEIGLAWMHKFPQYTRDNLDREGAMQLMGSTFHFVQEGHPVVFYMYRGGPTIFAALEPIPMPIQQQGQVAVKWYRLDSELFHYYVKELRDVVLHRAPSTFDLHTLTVRLVRPDKESWASLSPVTADSLVPDAINNTNDEDAIQQARDAAYERYVDRPLQVTLRIAIEYTLPQLEGQATTTFVDEDAASTVTLIAGG